MLPFGILDGLCWLQQLRVLVHAVAMRCRATHTWHLLALKAGRVVNSICLVHPWQITHDVSLESVLDPQLALDVFKVDESFEQHEAEYAAIAREILGDDEAGAWLTRLAN